MSMERRAIVAAWWDRLVDGRREVRARTAPGLSAESSFGRGTRAESGQSGVAATASPS